MKLLEFNATILNWCNGQPNLPNEVEIALSAAKLELLVLQDLVRIQRLKAQGIIALTTDLIACQDVTQLLSKNTARQVQRLAQELFVGLNDYEKSAQRAAAAEPPTILPNASESLAEVADMLAL